MIENYDPNFVGVHVVRATFRAWDYTGHVAFPIGGNCKGASLLEPIFLEVDAQDDIDRYTENDCQFSYDEDSEMYHAVLHRENGDTMEWSGGEDEFKDILVAMEIVECREPSAGEG